MLWIVLHFHLYGIEGFRDETLSGFVEQDAVYAMEGAELSLRFPSKWRMLAVEPCGTWSAKITTPMPWFGLTEPRLLSGACEDAGPLGHVTHATLAEVLGDTLLLTLEDGTELAFRRQ